MKDLFGHIEMKALSWKEPYASLMLYGKIETRTWKTNYRGPVLICASKKMFCALEVIQISGNAIFNRILEVLKDTKLQPGKAIAVGELIDCRPMTKEDEDKCFIQYEEGKYCHIYRNIRAVETFDWKGAQGWKNVSLNVMEKIKFI